MKIPLVSFEHVMGANFALMYLIENNFDVELADDAKEGDAKILIEQKEYEKAKTVLEKWIEDCKSSIGRGFK